MAGKRFVYFAIAGLIIIISGIAAISFVRSRTSKFPSPNDEKFIAAYIDLALTKEMVGHYPDSLTAAFDRIYRENGVDSTWIREYVKDLSKAGEKNKIIWGIIVEKLDSLKSNPAPDTIYNY